MKDIGSNNIFRILAVCFWGQIEYIYASLYSLSTSLMYLQPVTYLLSISNRLHYLSFFILRSTIMGLLLSRHETKLQVPESHGCRYAGSALSLDAPVCWNYFFVRHAL